MDEVLHFLVREGVSIALATAAFVSTLLRDRVPYIAPAGAAISRPFSGIRT